MKAIVYFSQILASYTMLVVISFFSPPSLGAENHRFIFSSPGANQENENPNGSPVQSRKSSFASSSPQKIRAGSERAEASRGDSDEVGETERSSEISSEIRKKNFQNASRGYEDFKEEETNPPQGGHLWNVEKQSGIDTKWDLDEKKIWTLLSTQRWDSPESYMEKPYCLTQKGSLHPVLCIVRKSTTERKRIEQWISFDASFCLDKFFDTFKAFICDDSGTEILRLICQHTKNSSYRSQIDSEEGPSSIQRRLTPSFAPLPKNPMQKHFGPIMTPKQTTESDPIDWKEWLIQASIALQQPVDKIQLVILGDNLGDNDSKGAMNGFSSQSRSCSFSALMDHLKTDPYDSRILESQRSHMGPFFFGQDSNIHR